MKIFSDKPWERGVGTHTRISFSNLCPECKRKFKALFDRKGEMNIPRDLPQACDKCKILMAATFESAKYPDRK